MESHSRVASGGHSPRGPRQKQREDNPMNTVPFIHYWGPPGAGRATSIGTILGANTTVFGDEDYPTGFLGQDIVLCYSEIATKIFYRADDPARPEPLLAMIERLSHSVGIVFVADSQTERREHNIASLERLRADLVLAKKDLERIPVVFQLNKRDLASTMSVQELRETLRTSRCDYVESVASKGVGTREAIERLLSMKPGRVC